MIRALTSASNLYRRALCPGSARMETDLSEPEQENEWSTEGTLLHACFMAPDAPERATLTLDQRETLEHAERLAEEFFANVRAAFGIPEDCLHADEKEYELWFRDVASPLHLHAHLFPGHSDLIRSWLHDGKSFTAIVDAKFGYVPVEHALDNLQLASYSAMFFQESTEEAIAAAIIQPRAFGPRLTQAIYTADSMPDAIKEIRDVYDNSLRPDAPLIAGEKQCFHCRAKVNCPAYKDVMYPVSRVALPEAVTIAVATATAEQLEGLKTAIQFADRIKDEVNDELRRRITAGAMPGWKLRNGGDDREVTEPVAMFRAFIQYFDGNTKFTAIDYDACRKMSWGKLESLVQEALGVGSKRAKEIVSDISEPFITRTPKEKNPVRDNKKLE